MGRREYMSTWTHTVIVDGCPVIINHIFLTRVTKMSTFDKTSDH